MIPMLSITDIENIEIQIDSYHGEREKLIHRISTNNVSMQEFHDVNIEIQCIDHDLYVYNLSLELGYDIMKYGPVHLENSETDRDSEGISIP